MDKLQEFRNRMNQLKSYRENNPGMTYLDWKKSFAQNRKEEGQYDWDQILNEQPNYNYELNYYIHPFESWNMINEPSDTHFYDQFKKINHPTFSNESIYSNKYHEGGNWDYQNGKDIYNFSDYTFDHSDQTLDYLKYADPNVEPVYEGGYVLPSVEVIGNYDY